MIIAITGATGFIGRALAEQLAREGHVIRRLTRSPSGATDFAFDPARRHLDPQALEGAHAVVHLAGEPIAQRWTAGVKRRIRESRVEGTRLMAETIAALQSKPRVLISGSAVGIYGDRGDEMLTESSAPGTDFLAEVAQAWEEAAAPARAAGVRVAHPRTGIVLHRSGGALEQMLLPFRLGAGGALGSGRQWWSWISLHDTVAALRFALDSERIVGPFNLVAPAPVTNAEFTRALGRALHRPTVAVVPAFALRLLFDGMADAALLASQRVKPEALLAAGFAFQHRQLEAALDAALTP